METYIPLAEIPAEFDIKNGECIYLASDITRLAHTARKNEERFDPFEFLSSFQNALGENGTLLIPSFNYNLRKNAEYDVVNTPPITGILSQYALKAPGFARTFNALHSFAVWGKGSNELLKMENDSSFSENSPFGWMHKNNARMLVIDLDLQSSLTFAHYCEEAEKVKYRSWKKIPVHYKDANGKSSRQIFKLFAKKAGYINNVNRIEDALIESGAMTEKTLNGINLLSVQLDLANEVIVSDIRANKARNIVFFNTKAWAKSMVKTAIGKK
jgi:aminoglycoside 3-N-acetyltransferase